MKSFETSYGSSASAYYIDIPSLDFTPTMIITFSTLYDGNFDMYGAGSTVYNVVQSSSAKMFGYSGFNGDYYYHRYMINKRDLIFAKSGSVVPVKKNGINYTWVAYE